MARLCSLLRAIVMKINRIESRRKYFQKIYNYLVRLYGKIQGIELINISDTVHVIMAVKTESFGTTRYAIAPNGRVYSVKGSRTQPRLAELNEVDELTAMNKIENELLKKAKELAQKLGIDVEKILHPPRKPKQKTTTAHRKKPRQSNTLPSGVDA